MRFRPVIGIIAAVVLFVGAAPMPIGYYTFLRIIVSACAAALAYVHFVTRPSIVLAVVFAMILILFNPIVPIYLKSKSVWVVVDIGVGALFLVYAMVSLGNWWRGFNTEHRIVLFGIVVAVLTAFGVAAISKCKCPDMDDGGRGERRSSR